MATTPALDQHFSGVLPKDSQQAYIPSARGFATSDATGTPVTSPVSTTTGAVTTLTTPSNAVELVISPTTDLRISENVGMTTYDIIKAGTKEVVAVHGLSAVYIKNDSANGTVTFRYITL